jgi:hypothetical protein
MECRTSSGMSRLSKAHLARARVGGTDGQADHILLPKLKSTSSFSVVCNGAVK